MIPCNYFLWGLLKNQVFSTPPHTIAELRQGIITEVDAVKRNRMLVRRTEGHASKSTFVYGWRICGRQPCLNHSVK